MRNIAQPNLHILPHAMVFYTYDDRIIPFLLTGCRELTDDGVATISRCCPELRYLSLIGCPKVTNSALFTLVSSCVNLERLDLAGEFVELPGNG